MEFDYALDGYTVVLRADVSQGLDKMIMITYHATLNGVLVRSHGPYELKSSKGEDERRLIIATRMIRSAKKASNQSSNIVTRPKKKVSFSLYNEVQDYVPESKPSLFPITIGGYLQGKPYTVLA
jgi:hypothetical protein